MINFIIRLLAPFLSTESDMDLAYLKSFVRFIGTVLWGGSGPKAGSQRALKFGELHLPCFVNSLV